jgi:ribosomal protein S27AE
MRAALRQAIVEAVTDACDAILARVRVCPRCGAEFLKHHKQIYCSSRCMEQSLADIEAKLKTKVRTYRARHRQLQHDQQASGQ